MRKAHFNIEPPIFRSHPTARQHGYQLIFPFFAHDLFSYKRGCYVPSELLISRQCLDVLIHGDSLLALSLSLWPGQKPSWSYHLPSLASYRLRSPRRPLVATQRDVRVLEQRLSSGV